MKRQRRPPTPWTEDLRQHPGGPEYTPVLVELRRNRYGYFWVLPRCFYCNQAHEFAGGSFEDNPLFRLGPRQSNSCNAAFLLRESPAPMNPKPYRGLGSYKKLAREANKGADLRRLRMYGPAR